MSRTGHTQKREKTNKKKELEPPLIPSACKNLGHIAIVIGHKHVALITNNVVNGSQARREGQKRFQVFIGKHLLGVDVRE